jgi:hypothetical protein
LGVSTRWARPALDLAGWILASEDQGILVIQTHRVPTQEMSGFSVSMRPHPIVALNRSFQGEDASRTIAGI